MIATVGQASTLASRLSCRLPKVLRPASPLWGRPPGPLPAPRPASSATDHQPPATGLRRASIWALAAFLFLTLASVLSAAVSGTVINRTTGKPQGGALLTLYQLGGEGMQPVKSVKTGPDGAFAIDHTPQGPHLLQTIHDGVVYNRMVQPGSSFTGLELDVYDSSRQRDNTSVTQHMVLIEPMGGILHVNESLTVNNTSQTTFNDPQNGALQVYLPTDMNGQPRLMVTAPQGMPVSRDVVKTEKEGVYAIDFPVKPGETRFDLTYVLPETQPVVFTSKVLHSGAPVRLVAPNGVTLSGEGVAQIGQEPRTQARVYEVKGSEYSVEVQGTGSLSVPEEASAGGEGRGIEQIHARIYDRVAIVVGLALLILMAGFIVLYRRPSPSEASAPPAASNRPPEKKGKRRA